ncbi:MAG: hypothetical protein MJ066_06425 [Clostridia bacterium]|nr:hypothetical protein [Clostridia bacterium]
MKNFSIKKLVLIIIAIASSCVLILGLLAPVVSSVTGYNVLGEKWPKDTSSISIFIIILKIFVILAIIVGALFLLLSIVSLWIKDYKKYLDICMIWTVAFSCIYMILGIVGCGIFSTEYGLSVSTEAFLPLIFTGILGIAYIVCGKVLSFEKSESSQGKMKEEDKIGLMLKYKELLNEKIITEEEFNEKKKELL